MTSRLTKEEWNNLQPGDLVMWDGHDVFLLLVLERNEEYGELFCWYVTATNPDFVNSFAVWSYDGRFKRLSS